VFDLEEAARKNLPPAHFAYLATGVEADATLRANREGFAKFQIRARRLVDTSRIDASVKLFGTAWPTPIVLAPVSSLRAFHPDGDIAVARAARARNHLQVLSTLATASVEDVIGARGAPVWFQLYPTTDWNITRALVKRAEAAGCPVVAITVDNPTSAGRETLARGRRLDSRDCSTCHSTEPGGAYRRKPMFDGIDTTKLTSTLTAHLTWDFVHRLQDITSMKIVLKGIVTAEDATLALSHGVNGLIVSNHGGRGEESARSTIEALPEVVEAIGGKIPVLVDSGFRRGTDIFKALALGANAVCVGRPYAWGLAAFGQSGVERSLEILNAELEITMRSMGTPTVQSITRAFVLRA
jgi:isopentenyl diphosphate isomerase/L-lactate dehydrogenase-like FMN-dependent dehydrogenase